MRDDQLTHLWPVLAAPVERLHQACEATLQRQITIASIAAPTGGEASRADVIRRSLGRSGIWRTSQDGVGNVIARLSPTLAHTAPVDAGDANTSPVVVMAHLDTVFEDDTTLTPVRDGSRISCPGIGDNSRGLAVLIALARAFEHDDLRRLQGRPLEFVASVGEEAHGNLRGARHYFDARNAAHESRPHAMVALDGPGDRTIVHHAIASCRLRVELRGAGGHSWLDSRTANPVHAAGSVIASIGLMSRAARNGASIAVTRMHGGESLTSIPQYACLDIDIRALDPGTMRTLLADVHRAVESARRDAADVTPSGEALVASVLTIGDRPGGALDADHPLVQIAMQATAWQGLEPQSAMASTDANIPLSREIPAIAIGAGGTGGGAHTTSEWYDDTHGSRGAARALGIIAALACDAPSMR